MYKIKKSFNYLLYKTRILRPPIANCQLHLGYLNKTLLYCGLFGYFVCSMSLFTTSLNSGSNGNCYYIGNSHEAVLIDAGISCRETEKRMKRLGLDMNIIKAIFISHEHGDHICGVEALAAKYRIPVFITPATLQNSTLRINKELLASFKSNQPITIGKLSILPFSKQHDASDPHSFVITDIGAACSNVIQNFKQCNAVFLEANYDEAMLENGKYPHHLKRRITSDHGHLSNRQALDLFLQHRPSFMTHLYLSHLSKDNNSPELVSNMFSAQAGNTEIVIASRYKETPVYHITGDGKKRFTTAVTHNAASQLSLF